METDMTDEKGRGGEGPGGVVGGGAGGDGDGSKPKIKEPVIIDRDMYEALVNGNKEMHKVLTAVNYRQEAFETIQTVLFGCLFQAQVMQPEGLAANLTEVSAFMVSTGKVEVAAEIERISASITGAITTIDESNLDG